jgi:hypothetical protein
MKSGKVVIVAVIVAGFLIAFALAAGIYYIGRNPRPRKLIWHPAPPTLAVSAPRPFG